MKGGNVGRKFGKISFPFVKWMELIIVCY